MGNSPVLSGNWQLPLGFTTTLQKHWDNCGIGRWDIQYSNAQDKGLFKYLVIIFWPTPDSPPPTCDQV